jgi:hypothetical protein
VLYAATQRLARRSRGARLLALRDDASELLLLTKDGGLRLWLPQSGRERDLSAKELSGSIESATFGPAGTLLLLGRQWGGQWGEQSDRFVLVVVDEASGRALFKRRLGAETREPSFGSSGVRRLVRALVGDDLVAWDIQTGAEAERWKGVSAYKTLDHGTLLAFLDERQLELATVSPPERLVSVDVLTKGPSALVTSPDGRFEILGDRRAAAAHLRCSSGHVVLPFSACTERYEWPGLLKERLGHPLPR